VNSNIPGSLDAQVAESLYVQSERVYPREVHGIYATMRVLAVVILLGLFYGVLWLHWDGQQLLLFDLPARRFHIFGLTLFPQDFFYLSAIMIIGALTLFFFTALAGRLWCGYACPQTVWTEVFLWIERKVEGDRRNQMKLDKSPWTVRKLAIKTTKHGIWIALSLWTGFTFVGYFTPVLELGARFMTWDLGPWEFFWIFFYGFATYGNAGWMREQVCIYMCPYARFQSAMFDNNTLVISYDSARGESRGARKRSTDHRAAGLGDCIDCTMCVQVCPTGIDIRDGLQYQCIACAACVDACDRVMDKMGYEKGLIRYTTENALSGEKARILRPLVVIYGIALLALVVALAVGIASRTPLVLDVIRDRNTLYRETGEGLVENVYTLKLINMDDTDHRYAITVSGIEGMELDLDRDQIPVAAHEVLSVSARVRADPYSLERASSTIVFTLQSVDDVALKVEEEARFLGPVAQAQ
jgi:cytochrome c oxidase accessory protein FixG